MSGHGHGHNASSPELDEARARLQAKSDQTLQAAMGDLRMAESLEATLETCRSTAGMLMSRGVDKTTAVSLIVGGVAARLSEEL